MTTITFTKWAAAIAVAGTIGTFAWAEQSASNDAFAPRAEFLAGKLAQLGITEQQKQQIHAILREYAPTTAPKIRQLVTVKRALRDTIHATPVDEAAIRAQAAKVAALEA